MTQGDITTPTLGVPNSDLFDGISPTKPLTLPRRQVTRNVQASHSQRFKSELSLNSILTQQTEETVESFETADEFRHSSINDAPALSDQNTEQDDTMIRDYQNSEAFEGLGIDRLSLQSFGSSGSIERSKSTISINKDGHTIRADTDSTISAQSNFYSFEPPMKATTSADYADDETPIVGQAGAFMSPIQETPIIKQTPRVLVDTPEGNLVSSPRWSDMSNAQIVDTPKAVKLKRFHESPRTEVVSPKKSLSIKSKETDRGQVDVSDLSDHTSYSHETTSPHGLESTQPSPKDLKLSSVLPSSDKRVSKFIPKETDYALTALFVVALHSFDADTLEMNSDSAICLSFNEGDVAFVHSVDASGWAEVTLLKSIKRGWTPINFFTEFIEDSKTLPLTKSKIPLRNLLISGAIFLNNPPDNPENGEASFSIIHINNIRDGVRDLLELTDCLSRSTDIVKKRPIVRRMRKSLLADWYNLMIKADSYKHSNSLVHLQTLQLMVLQVINKSFTFFEIWCSESESFREEQRKTNLGVIKPVLAETKAREIKYLRDSPFAKTRLNEIHNLLFSYIGLLLGRLNMAIHNPAGCQVLENVAHQMILLLREILFISKLCVLNLNGRNTKIDSRFDENLDTLLSLVSDLVSGVKNFVIKTIHEDSTPADVQDDSVHYRTAEGDELIGIVSRMTSAISSSVENCYKNLSLIGDFRLPVDRKYPDFQTIQITPEEFIRICSMGRRKALKHRDSELGIEKHSQFSMKRSGLEQGNLSTSSGSSSLLQDFEPDSKSFMRSSVFQPFLTDSKVDFKRNQDIRTEIIRDADDRLVGVSFRALVMILTDEMSKPDQFLVSTFFLTFRQFSTGADLIQELISRFNLTNEEDQFEDQEETGEYSSYQSRLKNRRKLVCNVFQIWLQSYWDYANDDNLLPDIINFFNEGVSFFLPIEAKRLIELCSKLTVLTSTKIQESKKLSKRLQQDRITSPSKGAPSGSFSQTSLQLVKRDHSNAKRSSLISHSSSVYSISSLNKALDDDDYIFEEYELAKLNTSNRSSMMLPLPGISFKNNSLLSKSQIQEIENSVLIYRRGLTSKLWVHGNNNHYIPVDLKRMLNMWFWICQTASPKLISIDYNLSDLNSFELAKQLTIIESKIFLAIRPEELLNNNFTEKRAKLNLAPNVSQSLLFTNTLSEYILDSILDLNLNNKKRITRIRNWLNTALSCYYLKNFNSLGAIVITLQNHILSRLNELWLELPEKYQNLFEDLKKIIHPENNYKGYRYKISKILEDVDSKSSIPLVPYINLFLQDLIFVDEGNKDFRNSNSFRHAKIINFDKFLRISKIVSNLECLQVGYDDASLKNSHSKKSKRNSIFSLSSSMSGMNEELSPNLPLQELILLELWRVHQLNLKDSDRNWSLSKRLRE